MSDILSTPLNDSVVTKKRTKRITGARNLTSEEYVEMLREDKKKIEAEELKEKRKHEREKRKRKIEEKKETQLKKRKGEEEKDNRRMVNARCRPTYAIRSERAVI